MSEIRHHGFCTLCRSRCGAVFVTQDGRLREVLPDDQHPTGGALCAKGRSAPEILADRGRLTQPLRRKNPKTEAIPLWETVSWDEALSDIASRLSAIRDAHGADSMLFASTTPSGTAIGDSFEWIEAFIRAFGSANFVVAMEICNFQKDFGPVLTTGGSLGTPDYKNADAIVLWGHNPARTWLAASSQISARAAGVPLVVIDPQRQGSGSSADIWLGLRPGSDGALAMGAIHHLLVTQTFDVDFVRDWTDAALLVNRKTGKKLTPQEVGLAGEGLVAMTAEGPVVVDTALAPRPDLDPILIFSGEVQGVACDSALSLLESSVAPWTRSATAQATGLSQDAIDSFFALLSSKARIALGHWSGLSQSAVSTQNVRAITALFSLRGDVDRIGSNRWFAGVPVRPFVTKPIGKPLGADRIPMGPPRYGYVTMRDALEAIETGIPYRPRGFFTFGTNPLASYPDWERAAKALASLDFRVHCDVRMTPMADSADYLLPVTLPWEHASLRPGFELDEVSAVHVQYRPAVVKPTGDQRPDYEIIREIARNLGFEDPMWHGSIEEAWNLRLAPSRLDIATLKDQPRGVTLPIKHPVRSYASTMDDGRVKGFGTPSRRIEFHSTLLADIGEPALPVWVKPAVDPAYPLVFTTAKRGVFTQSSLRYVPSLARRANAPEVAISPATAREAGLVAGDWCRIIIPTGHVLMKVRLDEDLAVDVMVGEHGWWQQADAGDALGEGSNINYILRNGADDPVSGAVELRRIACRIEKDEARSRGHWTGKRDFHITDRRDHAGGIVELVMEPVDAGWVPAFVPGQHVAFAIPELDLERHYSLISEGHSASNALSVAIRRSGAGGLSDHVFDHVFVGSKVQLSVPNGRFRLPVRSTRPVVMLAGGIGITPFLGYLRALAAQAGEQTPPAVTLIYASRDAAFDAELRALKVPNLTYVQVESGRNLDPLLEGAGPGARAFLCGSEPFMQAARDALLARGVDAASIQQEHFAAQTPVTTGLEAAKVTLASSGQSFEWRPGQISILAAAEEAGFRLAAGCRAGECESCALRLLAGTVCHTREVDEDACLTCCAVPIGDITLDA
ncbi:molybdopterin-dependent oxidoreductase [Novosphingobium humi]|uniref:Molybdopterin-dependent oxidoreductase n=1 Tax=Novosphingobium humi TaxID=2282397 RepID=A0ABY7U0V2_9SPHN|nr:molybdopterin-dependent oxidoreductase [Novosphingobium humi]WCT79138.1 molybdopterin-dependent oxidoreductase [Novosphingobium humi]